MRYNTLHRLLLFLRWLWQYEIVVSTFSKSVSLSKMYNCFLLQMYGVAFRKKDDSLGFRFLIQSEDDSLVLVQQPGAWSICS